MRIKTFIIGAIAALTTATQAQNLLDNGSFETSGPGFVAFESWANFGNIFQADSGEIIAQDGSFTAKMFGATNGAQSDQVLTQNVPATEGELYTLTTYCQNLSSDSLGEENVILAQLVFRNASGDALETVETDAIDPVSDPLDTWVMAELSAVAPVGTTNVDVFLLHIQLGTDQGFPTQGGGASFWDNVSLTTGDAPCSNPADLNGDGELNFFDVSAFLTLYGEGC
ncbi:MAG: hypothetical protein JJ916_12980 [Phycisphaerales bacterium]|nr:hypothetical protein [Phycisphaerales bacterium]